MMIKTERYSSSFNEGARKILEVLYSFEEKDTKCPPKKKRSPEQKAQSKEALQQAQAQGGGFDKMPQQQVEAAARKGGETPRKKKIC